MGAIWNFTKGTGPYNLVQNTGHKGPVLRPIGASGSEGLEPEHYSITPHTLQIYLRQTILCSPS